MVGIVTAHGDDFVHIGRKSTADDFITNMKKKLDVEVQQAGPGHLGKEVVVLNRRIIWKDDRIEYHPDTSTRS